MDTSAAMQIQKYHNQSLNHNSPLGILGRLENNVIKYIVSFLDIFDLMRFSPVCRYFTNIIHEDLKTAIVEEANPLPGEQNMNTLYLSMAIPQELDLPYCLILEVMTKDQGWASVDESSSWIEIRLLDQEEQCLQSYCFAKNYCEKDFKHVKEVIHWDTNQELLNHIKKQTKFINMYARSAYPGWRTYVNNAKMQLYYR